MNFSRVTVFRPWMLIYAGLIVAIAFTIKERGEAVAEGESVTPVVLESQSPLVQPNRVVRRSDI